MRGTAPTEGLNDRFPGELGERLIGTSKEFATSVNVGSGPSLARGLVHPTTPAEIQSA
jgi:hypothetical protein